MVTIARRWIESGSGKSGYGSEVPDPQKNLTKPEDCLEVQKNIVIHYACLNICTVECTIDVQIYSTLPE